MSIEIIPVTGMPEVRRGDDIAQLLGRALTEAGGRLQDGDIVVIAQKIVSKAEGAVRDLRDVVVGERARELARSLGGDDARRVQVVLDESVRIVREERVLIVETRHGFVCANAGVDNSNVEGEEIVTLLPRDCDASAQRLHDAIRLHLNAGCGVIVSDTFGRPWRDGLTNVALGVAGMPAVIDYRGGHDDYGVPLHATVLAIADELAGAAELVMGKVNRVPVAIVRGYEPQGSPGTGRDLIRPKELDLFR